MPSPAPLCLLIGINPISLSKEKNLILQAELFYRLCTELKMLFRAYYKDYFRALRLTLEMEESMLDANFIRSLIKDLLVTGDYTLSGIANCLGVPEDVIYEITTGSNTSPSARVLQGVIELHRLARPTLYAAIMKKITEECLST